MDCSLVIELQKKPKAEKIEPCNSNVYVKAGAVLAQKIKRWTDDLKEAFETAQRDASRPEWLPDRPCDNWGTAFTIAKLAGCEDMALNAAEALGGIETLKIWGRCISVI